MVISVSSPFPFPFGNESSPLPFVMSDLGKIFFIKVFGFYDDGRVHRFVLLGMSIITAVCSLVFRFEFVSLSKSFKDLSAFPVTENCNRK